MAALPKAEEDAVLELTVDCPIATECSLPVSRASVALGLWRLQASRSKQPSTLTAVVLSQVSSSIEQSLYESLLLFVETSIQAIIQQSCH